MALSIGPCPVTPVVPDPPVTATVTGLPCPLAAPFVWQGTVYGSMAAFIAAVAGQVPGASYNAATCTFTAPAGSAFPSMVVSAPPSTVLPNCPTPFPLMWEGVIYTTSTALDAALSLFVEGAVSYNAATCTFTQTSGPATTQFPITVGPVPSQTIAPCPIIYPTVLDGVSFNSPTALRQAIELAQDVKLSFNQATCTFTQIGGNGIFTPVALQPMVIVTPTGSGAAACPLAFPVIYLGETYNSVSTLTAAVAEAFGATVTYLAATCQFKILTGPVTVAQTDGVVLTAPVVCYLTLSGDALQTISGERIGQVVDCLPSQRAAYEAAGFTTVYRSDGSFLTMARNTPGTECGINFTEPLYDMNAVGFGYVPY